MRKFVGISMMVIGAGAILYLRFSNPAMTETQLFIKHWFDFLVPAAILVYGYQLLAERL